MIERLSENLKLIQQRIEIAAQKSGRVADDIRLVGVTKSVDVEVTRSLFEAGCTNLGESRPQTLWDKSSQLADIPITWHLIGHLQRNKVKRTLACAELIHSVDSLRLIDAIDQAAESPVKILLEVNVSGDAAKHGLKVSDVESVLEHVVQKANVRVEGLMCMAGLESNLDQARREFAVLRTTRDKHSGFQADNIRLVELSMGMSGDFEVAIEEGATMVRVGTSLFEGIG